MMSASLATESRGLKLCLALTNLAWCAQMTRTQVRSNRSMHRPICAERIFPRGPVGIRPRQIDVRVSFKNTAISRKDSSASGYWS